MLALFWPRYRKRTTGADDSTGDGHIKKAKFGGPVQLDSAQIVPELQRRPAPVEAKPEPKPLPWYDGKELEQAFKQLEAISSGISDAQARYALMQTMIQALEAEMARAEFEEMATAFILMH